MSYVTAQVICSLYHSLKIFRDLHFCKEVVGKEGQLLNYCKWSLAYLLPSQLFQTPQHTCSVILVPVKKKKCSCHFNIDTTAWEWRRYVCQYVYWFYFTGKTCLVGKINSPLCKIHGSLLLNKKFIEAFQCFISSYFHPPTITHKLHHL